MQNNERIVFISHSRNLEAFFAESFGENGKCINSKWIKNCEVKDYEINL
jgi:hypothetical protein